jgi:hypothetical protein
MTDISKNQNRSRTEKPTIQFGISSVRFVVSGLNVPTPTLALAGVEKVGVQYTVLGS